MMGRENDRKVAVRRRGVDPVLAGLREADCTVSIAARIGGPAKVRTSLSTARGRMEIGDAVLAAAEIQIAAVKRIGDADARKVVALAMQTDACTKQRTMREIAEMAGVPLTSAYRALHRGLEELRGRFADAERRAA